jgi:hypothetical protein
VTLILPKGSPRLKRLTSPDHVLEGEVTTGVNGITFCDGPYTGRYIEDVVTELMGSDYSGTITLLIDRNPACPEENDLAADRITER